VVFQAVALGVKVPPSFLLQLMQILFPGFPEAEADLASLRECKALLAGVSADLLYILLCLGAGGDGRVDGKDSSRLKDRAP
jgi:hypothetical protein